MQPTTASAHPAAARGRRSSHGLLGWLLLVFLLSCVFDPADQLLGAKVWIFVACWLCVLADFAASPHRAELPIGLLAYVILFILVPLLSIVGYFARGGGEPYGGFTLFKGYILITFAWLLTLARIDLFRQLSAVLTWLAVAILLTLAALLAFPEIYLPLYLFGETTGIVQLDPGRDYGGDVVLMQVYYVTSPMLAISIAYYYDQAVRSTVRRDKLKYAFLALLHGVAMMVAGSRNNILIAATLPIALWFLYTPHKVRGTLVALTVAAALLIVFWDGLAAFFDPVETSNSAKLLLVRDYSTLFDNTSVLLFGQGLGAHHEWSERSYLFVTELTYHETIRNFGLVGATVMFALLLFPVYYAFFRRRHFKGGAVVLGYVGYLVMCASNPLLFSSMGTLILSMILALIYRRDGRRPSPPNGHAGGPNP